MVNMNTDSLIEFPCHFPIKIIGSNSSVFVEEIITIVSTHFPELDPETITQKSSKDENYIALTVTVYVHNQKMLDAIYQDVTQHPQVKMVL